MFGEGTIGFVEFVELDGLAAAFVVGHLDGAVAAAAHVVSGRELGGRLQGGFVVHDGWVRCWGSDIGKCLKVFLAISQLVSVVFTSTFLFSRPALSWDNWKRNRALEERHTCVARKVISIWDKDSEAFALGAALIAIYAEIVERGLEIRGTCATV